MIIGDVGEGTLRGGRRRRARRQLRLADLRGHVLGAAGMTNPVHSLPPRRPRRVDHRRLRLPRHAVPGSEYRGDYFFADYAQNWIKRLTFDATGNVTAVRNFEPPDGSLDGPYGDIVGARRRARTARSGTSTPARSSSATPARSAGSATSTPTSRRSPRRRRPRARPGAARRRVLERRLVRPRGPAAELPLGLRRRHDLDRRRTRRTPTRRAGATRSRLTVVGRHALELLGPADDHRRLAARRHDPRARPTGARSAPARRSRSPAPATDADDGAAPRLRAVLEGRLPPRRPHPPGARRRPARPGTLHDPRPAATASAATRTSSSC